jgi:hypothetical protein
LVTPADAFIDGVVQASARDMDILPDLDEKDRSPGILADRDPLAPGIADILQNLFKGIFSEFGLFLSAHFSDARFHIFPEVVCRFIAKPLHRFGNFRSLNLFHGASLFPVTPALRQCLPVF